MGHRTRSAGSREEVLKTSSKSFLGAQNVEIPKLFSPNPKPPRGCAAQNAVGLTKIRKVTQLVKKPPQRNLWDLLGKSQNLLGNMVVEQNCIFY